MNETPRETALVALVHAQHRLIAELRDAVQELAHLLDEEKTADQWARDRRMVLVMVAQAAAEAGMPSAKAAWGTSLAAADVRRKVARELHRRLWRTSRIARAFGSDPATVHNMLHRQRKTSRGHAAR